MEVTLDKIKAAGKVPESLYNIAPGTGVLYLAESDDVDRVRELALALYDKCSCQREGFALKLKVEATDNPLLGGCVVAKRLNLGSLLRYNLLVGKLNCMASVDAFVKEFFNLTSRDDSSFKYIDKSAAHRFNYDPYSDYGQSRFNSHNMMMGMIIARPRHDAPIDEEDLLDKTPEQIVAEQKILQQVLEYADKYKMDVPKEILFPILEGTHVLTDDANECKLVFTNDREFWLKSATSVKLDLTKLQKAFYLLLLAHPKGIEVKKLSDYGEYLADYYNLMLKKDDGDSVEKTIKAFLERIAYNDQALTQLRSKLNKQIATSIMNISNQSPFKVQYSHGLLHIDLPRKFFEWQENDFHFMYRD